MSYLVVLVHSIKLTVLSKTINLKLAQWLEQSPDERKIPMLITRSKQGPFCSLYFYGFIRKWEQLQ